MMPSNDDRFDHFREMALLHVEPIMRALEGGEDFTHDLAIAQVYATLAVAEATARANRWFTDVD
jgi:hypothetical protein